MHLGRALHLIEDACVPHHALGYLKEDHQEYETAAEDDAFLDSSIKNYYYQLLPSILAYNPLENCLELDGCQEIEDWMLNDIVSISKYFDTDADNVSSREQSRSLAVAAAAAVIAAITDNDENGVADLLESVSLCGDLSGMITNFNPYTVTCDVQVPAGEQLSVMPGALVRFQSDKQMTVNGNLEIGGHSEVIRFLSDENPDRGIIMHPEGEVRASDGGIIRFR